MNKKILLLFLFLPFIGCTTPNMIMKSWVGHREEELYRQWGPPTKVTANGKNGKIIAYEPDLNNKDKHKYINASKPVKYIGPRNNEYRKTKSFYISPMGTIYKCKIE